MGLARMQSESMACITSQGYARLAAGSSPRPPTGAPSAGGRRPAPAKRAWDVFVCHATEDKDDFARPLARELEKRGLTVWFDEWELKVGARVRRSIDDGLAQSQYGVVVISPRFFEKQWAQQELDGLSARESDGRDLILPVWHNIGAAAVRAHSPTLADRMATDSSKGVEAVADELVRAMGLGTASTPR